MKNNSILKIYGAEITEIGNKLNQLERSRVYEISGARMDGYLSTNINELRGMIDDLLCKIDSGEKGTSEKLAENLSKVKL